MPEVFGDSNRNCYLSLKSDIYSYLTFLRVDAKCYEDIFLLFPCVIKSYKAVRIQ